jgi:hypothetical protein
MPTGLQMGHHDDEDDLRSGFRTQTSVYRHRGWIAPPASLEFPVGTHKLQAVSKQRDRSTRQGRSLLVKEFSMMKALITNIT